MMTKSVLILWVLLASREGFAFPTEICQATAKVAAIEELSTFELGSRDVPSGINPGGAPEYSYTKVMRLEMIAVADGGSSSAPCKLKVGDIQSVVIDLKITNAPPKVGDEVRLIRTRVAQLFGPGRMARSETWSFGN